VSDPQIAGRIIALSAAIFYGFNTIVLSLKAIQKVGASVFAMFLNFEPVVILLLAWIVIGEDLSVTRLSGISMVVAALVISHWRVKPK